MAEPAAQLAERSAAVFPGASLGEYNLPEDMAVVLAARSTRSSPRQSASFPKPTSGLTSSQEFPHLARRP